MHLHSFSSADQALPAARQALGNLLRSREGRPLLFLSSGGSCLSLLDPTLASLLDAHCAISVLDERCDENPAVNNFAQLAKTEFFHEAERHDVGFIDTRVHPDEEREDLAMRLEASLHGWMAAHPDALVIATMGIGADGHTAGVMPFPEDETYFHKTFLDAERWVVGYDAGTKSPYPDRVTTSLAFLRDIVSSAVVYAVGTDKRSALERILASTGSLAETPARILSEMSRVDVFTDILL